MIFSFVFAFPVQEMVRVRGYEIVSFLLKQKSHLLNEQILGVLFTLVEGRDVFLGLHPLPDWLQPPLSWNVSSAGFLSPESRVQDALASFPEPDLDSASFMSPRRCSAGSWVVYDHRSGGQLILERPFSSLDFSFCCAHRVVLCDLFQILLR